MKKTKDRFSGTKTAFEHDCLRTGKKPNLKLRVYSERKHIWIQVQVPTQEIFL